jgi:hypothetical protein
MPAAPPFPPIPTPPGPPSSPTYPPAIKWGLALIIAGGAANWLYKNVSPAAAYSTIFIILIGLMATGGLDPVVSFIQQLGITAGS